VHSCAMNEGGPNLPPLGSGLQYLKRKKPSSFSGKPRGARKREPHPKEEAQLEDDRASKNQLHELLMSLLSSHLPSSNFTIQCVDVHMQELKRKKAEEEEMHGENEAYKALNEALIELARTNVDQKQIDKRSTVWNLDTQLYHMAKHGNISPCFQRWLPTLFTLPSRMTQMSTGFCVLENPSCTHHLWLSTSRLQYV